MVNCEGLLRKIPDVYVNNIRDTAKEVFAIIAVAWAVQEVVFIVLNLSLTKAHGTRALNLCQKKFCSRSSLNGTRKRIGSCIPPISPPPHIFA